MIYPASDKSLILFCAFWQDEASHEFAVKNFKGFVITDQTNVVFDHKMTCFLAWRRLMMRGLWEIPQSGPAGTAFTEREFGAAACRRLHAAGKRADSRQDMVAAGTEAVKDCWSAVISAGVWLSSVSPLPRPVSGQTGGSAPPGCLFRFQGDPGTG